MTIELLHILRTAADRHDRAGTFPQDAWQALVDAGAARWAVPQASGGDRLDPLELHDRYEAIAAANLAMAVILTQHDGAAAYLASSDSPMAADTLNAVVAGKCLLSVAISHLTTSRSGEIAAVLDDQTITLNGVGPWCTSVSEADAVVLATESPAGQVLALVPTDAPGVSLPEPPPIVSLSATRTGPIVLTHVQLPREHVIAGPMENVLSHRGGKVPLSQAFLALGHARGAIDCIRQDETSSAADIANTLSQRLESLRQQVRAHAESPTDAIDADRLRGSTITLAQEACLAAVTVHKGAALINHHPAARLMREALFLLVWSCPASVRHCTLVELIGPA